MSISRAVRSASSSLASGVLVAALLGACSSHTGSEDQSKTVSSSRSAPVKAPGARAIPTCANNPKCWTGNSVELLVADVFAECANDSSFGDPVAIGSITAAEQTPDDYLAAIKQKMQAADCDGNAAMQNIRNSTGGWILQRGMSACNAESGVQTLEPLSASGSSISATYLSSDPVCNPAPVGTEAGGALMAVQEAALNSCIAMRLRSIAPGAAGGEALLLSGAEQRELLEVIRERAQIALLRYSQLTAAFAIDPPYCGPDATAMQVLGYWAAQPANADRIGRIAADYASTLQLHTESTQDLLDLLSRSASARAERGPKAASLPEEDWGPGSWRQRALALLHGGDPLATTGGVSWKETVPTTEPWPTRDQLPFVSTQVREPQVAELRRLARECDVQDLVVDQAASCMTPRVDESGDRLYRSVEACLRNRSCAEVTQSGECATRAAYFIPANTYNDDFLLWKRYRIRPEHARTVSAVLAESLQPICMTAGGGVLQPGAYNIDGSISVREDVFLPLYSGVFVHLDRDARLRPRPLAQVSPIFGNAHSFYIPAELFPASSSEQQGFGANVAESSNTRRLAGAESSLAAVRSTLTDTLIANPGAANTPYLSQGGRMLQIVSGAIGDRQLAVRPAMAPNGFNVEQRLDVDPTLALWLVDILVPQGDSFFQGNSEDLAVSMVYDDPWAAGLGNAAPSASAFGSTVAAVTASPFYGVLPLVDDVPSSDLRRIRFYVPFPHWPGTWTVIAQKTVHGNPDTGVPGHYEYQTLTANLRLPDPAIEGTARAGFFIADGGVFGSRMAAMMHTAEGDPATPGLDAFGLPARWVPPSNPIALPGQPPSAAASFYLDKAKVAAEEATTSVGTALEGILQETVDEAAKNAAAVKARAVVDEQKKGLCGDGNDACDLSTQNVKFTIEDLWPNAPPCPFDPAVVHECAYTGQGDCSQVDIVVSAKCITRETLQQAVISASISNAVWEHRGDPSPPSFSAFSGGTAQTILIKQWSSLRQMKLAGDEVVLSIGLAESKLNAMKLTLEGLADVQAKTECDSVAGQTLLAPLQSVTHGILSRVGVSGGGAGTLIGMGAGGPVGASVGGAIGGMLDSDGGEKERKEKEARCSQLAMQVGQAEAQIVTTAWESIAAMTARSRSFLQSVVDLRLAEAELAQAKQQVKLASARAQLEADLIVATGGLKTQYGMYRRYHQYDLWRAKALLEAARIQAVIARRAIESALLVDMSTMVKDEPLVARPSSWADSIYEYDLNMPSAVGLSLGTAESGGIYANRLKDYVGNLDKFVQGFPIARPTAVAQSDADVLSIPGPAAKLPPVGDADPVSDPRAFSWQVYCDGKWKAMGSPQNPCESESLNKRPDRARIVFSVDPWGRVNERIANEPFTKRYNARWGKLAVNLVGTGILDCAKAKDPSSCYAQSFLRYDLAHFGPVWTPNYDQEWRLLGVPVGRIEGGKALAAEEWLDPVSNGWAKPFVSAVARTEYHERPFDGTYVLELVLGPEVRMDRIERVQVLTDATYWVKQQ